MPSYWEILESHAAARRERAFALWQRSGYSDKRAYEDFMANFVAANTCRARSRLRYG
jgi:hypothetical protein